MIDVSHHETKCEQCKWAINTFAEKDVELRKVRPRKRNFHPEIKCPDCGTAYVLVIDGRVQTNADFHDPDCDCCHE